MTKFKSRLQSLLEKNNLKKSEFAKALGVSLSTINGYLYKGYYPKIETLINISKFFNCSIDYLIGLIDWKV